MRSLIVFCAIIMALATFGSHALDRLRDVPAPKQQAMKVSVAEPQSVANNARSVVVRSGMNGHFQVDARVDGRPMNFVVDTGASAVALRASDAARLGIRPTPRDFTVDIRTANGSIKAARADLSAIDIGGVTVRNVRAIVLPDAALSENLLGMTFLSRLRRYEYSSGKLVMEQ